VLRSRQQKHNTHSDRDVELTCGDWCKYCTPDRYDALFHLAKGALQVFQGSGYSGDITP